MHSCQLLFPFGSTGIFGVCRRRNGKVRKIVFKFGCCRKEKNTDSCVPIYSLSWIEQGIYLISKVSYSWIVDLWLRVRLNCLLEKCLISIRFDRFFFSCAHILSHLIHFVTSGPFFGYKSQETFSFLQLYFTAKDL